MHSMQPHLPFIQSELVLTENVRQNECSIPTENTTYSIEHNHLPHVVGSEITCSYVIY